MPEETLDNLDVKEHIDKAEAEVLGRVANETSSAEPEPVNKGTTQQEDEDFSESDYNAKKDELRELLTQHGVDLDKWGTGEAKTLDHLVKEVLKGESELLVDESGNLARKVSVLNLEISHKLPDGRTLQLREDRQEFTDGRTRRRDLGCSIAEKLKAGEVPNDKSIERALYEELGIKAEFVISSSPTKTTKNGQAFSYPGLNTIFEYTSYTVQIGDGAYRPGGYIEHQSDKTNFFIWGEQESKKITTTGELKHINQDDQNELLRLMGQLTEKATDDNERQIIASKFQILVQNILRWAQESGVSVKEIKKLGGGFKNPVVLVTTGDKRSYVAKAFVEDELLTSTKRAQKLFSEICAEDEKIIPQSTFFEDVMFSAEAKGFPVRRFLQDLGEHPGHLPQAEQAMSALGQTLGMLHERSERFIDENDPDYEEQAAYAEEDTKKILKHLSELGVQSLVGGSAELMKGVRQRIEEFTLPSFVSLIQADAHLDQFFYSSGSLVEIVDYDEVRLGDPMSDVARAMGSLRFWCHTYGIAQDQEANLTRALINGYCTERHDDSYQDISELEQKRIVAYLLRINLLQLKGYTEIRAKLSDVAEKLSCAESDLIFPKQAYIGNMEREDEDENIKFYLSPEEYDQLRKLRYTAREIYNGILYLRTPVLSPQKQAA